MKFVSLVIERGLRSSGATIMEAARFFSEAGSADPTSRRAAGENIGGGRDRTNRLGIEYSRRKGSPANLEGTRFSSSTPPESGPLERSSPSRIDTPITVDESAHRRPRETRKYPRRFHSE